MLIINFEVIKQNMISYEDEIKLEICRKEKNALFKYSIFQEKLLKD